MKKIVVGGIVAAVALGGAALVFSMRPAPAGVAAAATAAAAPITQEKSGQVVAEGNVVPVRSVNLSPAAAGRVAEVLVKRVIASRQGRSFCGRIRPGRLRRWPRPTLVCGVHRPACRS